MRRAARSVIGAVVVAGWWLHSGVVVLAASPSPGAAGDPRSSGQGPGLVGDPAFALLAVVVIGALTVAVTLAYIRLTARRDT